MIILGKDGAAALDGIVETDGAVAMLTMNWRLTRPGRTIIFEPGEPICTIFPVRRSELEECRCEITDVAADTGLQADFSAWRNSRDSFNRHLAGDHQPGWQKHYHAGTSPGAARAGRHRTCLNLRVFSEEPKP